MTRDESTDAVGRNGDGPARQGFVERSAHLLALCSLAVAQPLLDLLARNGEFLVVHRFDTREVLVFLAVLLVAVPAPLLLVEALLGLAPARPQRWLHGALLALVAALWWTLVLKRTPLAGPAVVGGAVLLAVASVVLYLRLALVRSFLSILAAAIVVVPAVFLLQAPVRKVMTAAAGSGDMPIVGERLPVVFIVFDEFAATVLMNPDGTINRHRYPNLAALAERSTWFPNAATVADATAYAVPAILTGLYPDKEKLPTHGDYPRNLFSLLGGSHEIWAREVITRLCPDSLNRFKDEESSEDRIRGLATDLTVAYLHVLFPAPFDERLPSIADAWGGFGMASSMKTPVVSSSSVTLRSLRRGVRDAIAGDRRLELETFFAALAETSKPRLYFLHLLLPHRPWELLPGGERYPGGQTVLGLAETWTEESFPRVQAYQRYMLQVGYLDAAIGRLVRRLEELDLFDRSLLVLVGDHGTSFQPGEHRRRLTEGNALDIVPVPLLIKAPRQETGRIVRNPVLTIDILPTIFDLLSMEPRWPMDGRSVFDEAAARPSSFRVLAKHDGLHEVSTEIHQEKLSTVAWKREHFGDGEDPLGLFRGGPASELVGRRAEEIRQRPPRWKVRILEPDPAVLAGVAPDAREVPVFLRGTVIPKRRAKGCCRVAVAVNGTIYTTVVTLGLRAGLSGRPFTVMLPRSALAARDNRVEFFEIRGEAHQRFLIPLIQKKEDEDVSPEPGS